MPNENQPNPQSRTPESGDRSVNQGNFLVELMRGGVLNHRLITGNVRFFILWFFFALLFIYNRFDAEEKTRERTRLEREVKNLRSEWLSQQTELLVLTRQSGIMEKMKTNPTGLRPAIMPPYTIGSPDSARHD